MPSGVIAMFHGPAPVAIMGVAIGVSVPSAAIAYCEIVAPPRFAT